MGKRSFFPFAICMEWNSELTVRALIPSACFLVTCNIYVVGTTNARVFIVVTVVNTPSIVLTVYQEGFIADTVDLVQQNITSSVARSFVKPHTSLPDSQNSKLRHAFINIKCRPTTVKTFYIPAVLQPAR